MADLTITYKGSTIAELISSETKILQTSSKYCEADILLNYNATEYAEDKIIDRTISGMYINNKVTTIGSYAFYQCYSLTAVSFPACTTIGSYAFFYCSSLTTASFPACKVISYEGFYNCSNLTTISFPACTMIDANAFYSCYSLTTVSFPAYITIDANAFKYCYRLTSLYLTNSSVAKLNNYGAFSSTPISEYTKYTGKYGSIYVPSSLLTSYKTATNWTYYSYRFVGI